MPEGAVPSIWGFSTEDVWVSQYHNRDVWWFDGSTWRSYTLLSGPWGYKGGRIWGAAPGDLWTSLTEVQPAGRWEPPQVQHWRGNWHIESMPDDDEAGAPLFWGAATNDVYFVVRPSPESDRAKTVHRWNGREIGTAIYTFTDMALGDVWMAPDDGSLWIVGERGTSGVGLRGRRQEGETGRDGRGRCRAAKSRRGRGRDGRGVRGKIRRCLRSVVAGVTWWEVRGGGTRDRLRRDSYVGVRRARPS